MIERHRNIPSKLGILNWDGGKWQKSVLMTSHDIQLSLIPKIFRFLIHVSVGGPLVDYVRHSFIEMADQ